MKKILFLLLTFVMANVQSQTTVSTTDKDLLVQKCLTFQPLIDKIPAQVQGLMTNYYVLGNNFGTDFSQNLIVNGKYISFITKADISSTKPFFLFSTIYIENDKAFARYYFTYTNNGEETIIPVTLDLVKSSSVWQVVNYTI